MLALGIVLIVGAAVLLLAEAHLSSGGLLAIGATVALVGGVTLVAAASAAGLLAVIVVGAGAAAVSIGALSAARRTLRSVKWQRPRSGAEAMVGRQGVMRVTDSATRVFVDGALWRARPSPLHDHDLLIDGDHVIVDYINGLTLSVHKADELELS